MSILSLISRNRFVEDRRGSVAMTFGLTFVPALLMAGAAIDYSRTVTQWSNLQQATDATALVVAHNYLTSQSSPASLKTFAQSYINGLITGTNVSNVQLSKNNTVVCLSTTSVVPTAVMKIANILALNVATSACSQVGQTYEVALALDNSGSMSESAGGQSKIQALQAAVNQLIGILIPSGTVAPQVGISIVPFTSMVNVDVSNGKGRAAPFLDAAGISSIHWQNFHRPTGVSFTPVSKFDLFDGMGASWGGCVEERPVPYTTTDTAASSGNADTKFVPYLAPDEPGDIDNQYGVTCYPTGSSSCLKTLPPYLYLNSYIADTGSTTTAGVCSSSTAYANADNLTTAYPGDGQTNLYPGSGMSMVCKYKGSSPASVPTLVQGVNTGPNYMCTSQKMTPLTTDANALATSVKAMVANGSTNLAAGFMWAWRSISPVANPFPTTSTAAIGPQNPKSYTYGPPANGKVIILMTDGFNSWTSVPNVSGTLIEPYFRSLYEGFGYYADERLRLYLNSNPSVPGSASCGSSTTTAASSRCQLDNVTLEACQNAKNVGITIYTIGFSIPSDPIDQQGLNLLSTCASSSSKYFKATDSASIQSAFQQIASSILSLRLTQ